MREENERLKIIIKALTDKLRIIENSVYSNVEENMGVNNTSANVTEKNIGVNILGYSDDKSNIGVNTLIYSNDKSNPGVNSGLTGIIDNNIGGKRLNWMLAVNGLRKVIPTSSLSGIENAAKILVQLHEHPRNSYKELQKLTGLSEDGLAKRIMALKKRGLIVRTAFQQYTLTEKALKILLEAIGTS